MKMRISTKQMARIGVLSGVAALLFQILKIPVIPNMYDIDFSNLAALLGGFSMGPVAGSLIVLVKDLVGLLFTKTKGIGEMADFLVSLPLVACAAAVYTKRRTLKSALVGMALGILGMVIVGAFGNYFVFIPLFGIALDYQPEAIIGLASAVIPAIDSMWKLILLATIPFNLIKGLVLCGITAFLYKRLSPLLRG